MKAILAVLAALLLCSCPSPTSITDAEAVARDLAALDFADIAGANTAEDSIRFDLVLPTAGGNGTTIAWASSLPAVIATDGTVNRSTSGDVGVTLTATVSKNAANDSKDFLLTALVRVAVTWGTLQYPAATQTEEGVATESIYGRVFSEGVTNADPDAAGAGILAQLGYGPLHSDPAAGGWNWVNAAYNLDFEDNDEHMATLLVPLEGFYAYAYRFSGDDGNSWLYCDMNGTLDGYSAANQGVLEVIP